MRRVRVQCSVGDHDHDIAISIWINSENFVNMARLSIIPPTAAKPAALPNPASGCNAPKVVPRAFSEDELKLGRRTALLVSLGVFLGSDQSTATAATSDAYYAYVPARVDPKEWPVGLRSLSAPSCLPLPDALSSYSLLLLAVYLTSAASSRPIRRAWTRPILCLDIHP